MGRNDTVRPSGADAIGEILLFEEETTKRFEKEKKQIEAGAGETSAKLAEELAEFRAKLEKNLEKDVEKAKEQAMKESGKFEKEAEEKAGKLKAKFDQNSKNAVKDAVSFLLR